MSWQTEILGKIRKYLELAALHMSRGYYSYQIKDSLLHHSSCKQLQSSKVEVSCACLMDFSSLHSEFSNHSKEGCDRRSLKLFSDGKEAV